jgi:hypothetical protein
VIGHLQTREPPSKRKCKNKRNSNKWKIT